ncbi:MAG: hypothetical protein KGD58_07970 [Candidatus Lokiarchaeota archaeon]|nr:hypothetical protein [Candidatus Lokiarchaeota archaeon]
MNNLTDFVLYDSLNKKISYGTYTGSIISKCEDKIIFSDNMTISNSDEISISHGLVIGFDEVNNKTNAFSRKSNFTWKNLGESSLEYSVLISDNIVDHYNREQFTDDFPFTINLLHTAGLYLNHADVEINHLDFFKNEILKNPVSLIENGIIMADRVVINEMGDPVFYDSIIVGRDDKDEIKVSYETFVNVDDKNVLYIIILGIEELKE